MIQQLNILTYMYSILKPLNKKHNTNVVEKNQFTNSQKEKKDQEILELLLRALTPFSKNNYVYEKTKPKIYRSNKDHKQEPYELMSLNK